MPLAPMVFKRLRGLQSIPIDHAPEDPSETFKQGALLVFNATNGQIAEAAADPTVVQGVALVAASGTTGKDVPFIKPVKGAIFEVSIDESGLQGVYAQVQTDLGKQYGAAKDATTGFWYLDQDETTVKVFEIVSLVSPIGTVVPRVEVEFTLTAME